MAACQKLFSKNIIQNVALGCFINYLIKDLNIGSEESNVRNRSMEVPYDAS
jgi:hypothetical protein